MVRERVPAVVMFTAMAMIIASVASGGGASAAPSEPNGAEPPPIGFGPASPSSGEYVVVFDPGQEADFFVAVEEAGGTVVDVVEEVGMALVAADDGSFLAEVEATDAVSGAMQNYPVGVAEPGSTVTSPKEWPSEDDPVVAGTDSAEDTVIGPDGPTGQPGSEPLADLQWGMEMIGATPDGAHSRATGEGVSVGIIDTGIDASHPDIAPNFDHGRSKNFVRDIPEVDGPCEVPSCIDPPDVDHRGHGTHVAGIVGAARNGFGVGGAAPDVTLVSLRAGQDSGLFFLYPTVRAVVEAGRLGLDVVNMSFYVDPWLFNCDSPDDYIEGEVSSRELNEQALVKRLVTLGLNYAHARGVTLISSAGNEHLDLAAPERFDDSSPDYPPDNERSRTVTSDCLDMPAEGPHVISTSAVGPSTRKADYSNYGLGSIDIAAPGGWVLDFIGTPDFDTPGNRVLSTVPLEVAIENGWVDEDGQPATDRTIVYCDPDDTCGVYFYAQGTSAAGPHVAGVAALIIERYGGTTSVGSRALDPDVVADILAATATDHPCPAAGFEDYTPEGRPPDWNATCEGTTDYNGLYGEGIVNAADAVGSQS